MEIGARRKERRGFSWTHLSSLDSVFLEGMAFMADGVFRMVCRVSFEFL